MRTVRGGISFAGLIGAATAGVYLGAVVAGLLAVVIGQAFAAGSPSPAGAGVLALPAIGLSPDSPARGWLRGCLAGPGCSPSADW